MNDVYPVRFSVEYPNRALDRLTSAFRIFMVIPIAIVLASIGGYSSYGGYSYYAGVGGAIAIPPPTSGSRCSWTSTIRTQSNSSTAGCRW